MRRNNRLGCLFILAAFAASVVPQAGGPYTIPKRIIGGSGGTTTEGALMLDSTIGEPVSGAYSAGGNFNLLSGYMSDGATANVPVPSINGTVTYANAAVPPKYISNVTVTGTGAPSVFTTTAAPGATAGQYTLTGFGSGAYMVSLSKTTGVNGINSFDAARVAQHVAGVGPGSFTNEQRIAADVTNNGVINSFDAGKIAQYVAGLPLVAPNLSGTWRFFVPNPTFPLGASPTSRTYASVSSNITGDDYIGILGGEVTGNWAPSAARPAASATSGMILR